MVAGSCDRTRECNCSLCQRNVGKLMLAMVFPFYHSYLSEWLMVCCEAAGLCTSGAGLHGYGMVSSGSPVSRLCRIERSAEDVRIDREDDGCVGPA